MSQTSHLNPPITLLGGPGDDKISDILQCDGADTTFSSEVLSDISAHSDYLPYTNINVNDNTRPENENSENLSNDNTQEGADDPENQVIQVIVGNRTEGWKINKALPNEWRMRSNNITVKRDNRLLLANKLPTVFVTNYR